MNSGVAKKRWACSSVQVLAITLKCSNVLCRRRILSDDDSENDLQHTVSSGTMSTVAKTSHEPIKSKGFSRSQTDF